MNVINVHGEKVKIIKNTFYVKQTFFLNPCHLCGNVEEYCRVKRAT